MEVPTAIGARTFLSQCHWDLQLIIPEGWPIIAQRFNVGNLISVSVSPEGTADVCTGQPSLRDLLPDRRQVPTLKRWAMIESPSGTRTRLVFKGVGPLKGSGR